MDDGGGVFLLQLDRPDQRIPFIIWIDDPLNPVTVELCIICVKLIFAVVSGVLLIHTKIFMARS